MIRTIAYMLRGAPADHCMFMWYGPESRNGKTTLSKGVLHMFGDYATTLPPATLSIKNKGLGERPSPDIMRLVGERFVNIPETNKEYPLNAALVKALTGGDTMAIRDLYSGYQDFENKSVFVLHTNHLPQVDDDTLFASDRIVVIPFEYFLKRSERDVKMFEKLTSEEAKSSLLNMIIRKLKKNQKQSIKDNQPERIIAHTQQYKDEADVIAWFIRENVVDKHGEWTKTSDLVKRYNRWAKSKGLPSLTSSALTRKLKQKNYVPKHKNIGAGFKDIKLKIALV